MTDTRYSIRGGWSHIADMYNSKPPLCYRAVPHVVKATIFVARVFALLPFHRAAPAHYDYSWPHFVYSLAFISTALTGFTITTAQLYPDTQLSWNSPSINMLMMLFGLLYGATFVLAYGNHYAQLPAIRRLLGDAERLHVERMRPVFAANAAGGRRRGIGVLLVLYVAEAVGVPALLCYSYLIKIWALSPTYGDSVMVQTFAVLPLLTIAVTPALFYAGMLATYGGYQELNAAIARIAAEAASAGAAVDESEFRRLRRFGELSERLDAVAEAHWELGALVQRLGAIMDGVLPCWLTYKVVGALAQLFFCYMFVSGVLTDATFDRPSLLLVSGVLGVAMCGVEVALVAHVCLWTRQEAIYRIERIC